MYFLTTPLPEEFGNITGNYTKLYVPLSSYYLYICTIGIKFSKYVIASWLQPTWWQQQRKTISVISKYYYVKELHDGRRLKIQKLLTKEKIISSDKLIIWELFVYLHTWPPTWVPVQGPAALVPVQLSLTVLGKASEECPRSTASI